MSKVAAVLVPLLRFPDFLASASWSIFKVGDFLSESRKPSYTNNASNRITVRLNLRGVEQRTHRGTESVDATNHFLRSAGQFIYGKQNIHKGALGIIPKQLHGFETSQDLPCFDFKGHCSKEWFFYHFSREDVYQALELVMTGTGSKRLNEKTFLRLTISAPEYNEQQKIAGCLSSLDELIATQARKVDVLKTHKKGLMQQLFPREGETQPHLQFVEFQNSRKWTVSSIQELIENKSVVGHLDGNHGSLYPKAEEFSDFGIPYISAANFDNGGVDFKKCKHLPIERATQFKKGIARDGDILFAHNATVGPVAKLTTEYNFVILSTSLTYFRCDPTLLSNDFLKVALTSSGFVDQCTRVMSQSTRNQIPITTQRTFSLQLPTLPEQLRISACLTSLDDVITATTQQLEVFKIHKKGLLQQLFPSAESVDV